MIYCCTRAEIIYHTKISLKSGMKYVKKKKCSKKILKLMYSISNHEIDAMIL